MRATICLKSARRQTWRTILLLLLCAGISFVFLSQMLQYQVVQNAVDCSSAYYHAIGFLRAASSEVNDASPCLPALENSVYVDYINTFAARYGTMNGIHNVNLDGKDEWNLLYLQGTLKEINTKNENILHESINGEMYYMPRKVAVLTFEITDTFSGHETGSFVLFLCNLECVLL